ncbi:LOW QUALITY PROTEIN: hypothetical protein YC2023_043982 [Brassica napus]
MDVVDRAPSFLKALKFFYDHVSGLQLDFLLSFVKIEGNMRQAADVEHRDLEYEQGRYEFTPTEDA